MDARMVKFKKYFVIYLFLLPAFSAMLIFVFYPLFLGLFYSLTNINQFNMGSIYQKASYSIVGLKNYIFCLKDPYLYKLLKQTLIWTFFNIVFHVGLGLFLACLLNRPLKGRVIYRMLLLVPWAVPSFISAFSWCFLFNYDFGFINLFLIKLGAAPIPWLSDPFWSMFAAILTNIWLGVPFMMVIMLGGLQGIPQELYEAADVDGGSRYQKFMNITIPLLKPVAMPSILLGIIWTFNMFNIIYLVTGGGPYHSTEILVTFAYKQAFENWNFALASTYGVIILSILLVISTIYQRLYGEAGDVY